MHSTASIITTSLLLLVHSVSSSYLPPRADALYRRDYFDGSELEDVFFQKRAVSLAAVKESAKGGKQTMAMLNTTPKGNHIVSDRVAKCAGTIIGACEAVAFRNSKSADAKPMAPVATTGKDRPVTKDDYVKKAGQLSINTAKGPLGNQDSKSVTKAKAIGTLEGKAGFALGTAVDKLHGLVGKSKRSLDDEIVLHWLYTRSLEGVLDEEIWY